MYIMLLNLMAPHELREAIEYLRTKLNESKMINGYNDQRTIEIKNRLDLYLTRYSNMDME